MASAEAAGYTLRWPICAEQAAWMVAPGKEGLYVYFNEGLTHTPS